MIFEFTIGGYPGPSFHLEVINDQLYCLHSLNMQEEPQKAFVSIKENECWEAMINFLSTRKWKEMYIDHTIMDGTGWELTVKAATFQIKSCGENVFPPGFRKFLRLLNCVTQEVNIRVF